MPRRTPQTSPDLSLPKGPDRPFGGGGEAGRPDASGVVPPRSRTPFAKDLERQPRPDHRKAGPDQQNARVACRVDGALGETLPETTRHLDLDNCGPHETPLRGWI